MSRRVVDGVSGVVVLVLVGRVMVLLLVIPSVIAAVTRRHLLRRQRLVVTDHRCHISVSFDGSEGRRRRRHRAALAFRARPGHSGHPFRINGRHHPLQSGTTQRRSHRGVMIAVSAFICI